jgi:hypothetical protein
MEFLVLFGTDGVAERVAEDRIDCDRTGRRGGISVSRSHDETVILLPGRDPSSDEVESSVFLDFADTRLMFERGMMGRRCSRDI